MGWLENYRKLTIRYEKMLRDIPSPNSLGLHTNPMEDIEIGSSFTTDL